MNITSMETTGIKAGASFMNGFYIFYRPLSTALQNYMSSFNDAYDMHLITFMKKLKILKKCSN